MAFEGQTHYPHRENRQKRGVLLCNLGTPDAPTPKALRRYLREFLSDPRVVEVPRPIWWCILNLFILPLRPARSAAAYQKIWTSTGSPLLNISREQEEALRARLESEDIVVSLGMRYGTPSMEEALNVLRNANVQEIIILPLYPQYSGATTGSTFDAIAQILQKRRWVPQLSFINGYHKTPSYIQALADSVTRHIEQHGMPDVFLLSYHGTPEKYRDKGDPYYCQCLQTSRLLRENLGLDKSQMRTTFQSRFGREPWLQPYTDKTLEALPSQGVKNVAVLCPGFSADCLETLEEIQQEAQESFLQAGGESFHYIPALNASDAHVSMMADLVNQHFPQTTLAATQQMPDYEVPFPD